MRSTVHWLGRLLRRAGTELMKATGPAGVWIDVGAHHGETTLWWAQQNPGLKIYAFEPNPAAAAKLIGRASNYFVIPMAVSENDGFASLNINAFDAASSLLPMNEAALRSWVGGEALKVGPVMIVPTVRIDTFMGLAGIQNVDYLKIDAQGMDLAVVKSAGSRLRDIAKIKLEVDIKAVTLYQGAPSKDEVVSFLQNAGFSLASVEQQTNGQEENLTFFRAKELRTSKDEAVGAAKTGHRP